MATRASTPVELAIDDFEKSPKKGLWTQLKKADLISGLKERGADPYAVNQRMTLFCGPASIIFALIRNDAVRYVRICQQLFENGSFGPPLTRKKTFTASKDLLAEPPDGNTHPIDWMLAATLRESENLLFPATYKLGQLTLDGAMNDWATELLLNHKAAETTTCYLYGEMGALQKAQEAVKKGGVAFLLIDSAMLGQGIIVHVPTHWIALVEPITFTKGSPDRIRFYCYTWTYHWSVDEEEAKILNNIYGVVTAAP